MPDYPTIESCIGNTPLVRLQRLPGDTSNTLLAKLEGNNPAGSVKDRPALSMIVEAERRGDISPGDTLVEATSGNTGIALAMAAAIRGYRMVLIMPASASTERKLAMRAYGAELVEVSAEDGMEGARDLAEAMEREGQGRQLNQFSNPDNPLAHYRGTGPELWEQTGGAITHLVSSMGTTGTSMGCSAYLKAQNPALQIVGLQPTAGGEHSRDPPLARGLPAQDFRAGPGGPCHGYLPGRVREGHAPAGRGGGDLLRCLCRRFCCRGPAPLGGSGEQYHRFHHLRPRGPLPVHRRVRRELRTAVVQVRDQAWIGADGHADVDAWLAQLPLVLEPADGERVAAAAHSAADAVA